MNSSEVSIQSTAQDVVLEAVVLAGGLGTRLRSAVPDLPKCMAPVAGRPFLSFVIDALRMQGVQRFVFSLGYKADLILEFLRSHYPTLSYETVIEDEPLGTGGAIKLACTKVQSKEVLVANGDTLFQVNVPQLLDVHRKNKAECTLALKPLKQFDRYGVVEINKNNLVRSFKEKQFYEEGLINGGLYLLDREQFQERALPQKFSFEKEYLEKLAAEWRFYGSVQDGYFIDIGIPTDYAQAQLDLAPKVFDTKQINKTWTLFLDRDGVINNERVGSYILNWEGFVFSPGVLQAFRIFSERFGRIFIVSNQRGVGRQLMTEADLKDIHREMQREVEAAGGHIDRIYYCTDPGNSSFNRKPNPGMAFQAVRNYPDIDFSRSVMVGNKPSDMRFGRSAGMFTVFLTTTNPDQPFPHPDIDASFSSLLAFAQVLQS